MKKYNFSKDYIEIKINEKIYKAAVIATRDYENTDNGRYSISIKAQFPSEVIESLKSSSKVILRFHRENGFNDIVEVPDDVLAEWKQVIDMKE